MDFFEHQRRARRASRWLLVGFALAVAGVLALVNALAWLGWSVGRPLEAPAGLVAWLTSPACLLASAAALVLIAAGSAIQWLGLRAGGASVARLVGARALELASTDAGERRLRNVAEEMAIASGTFVPRLHVLDDEPGINAFVAGCEPAETVLVVTRGALERLNRDELQGVVAHEFSHVLHGDTRLNMHLMALLGGLLMLSRAGRALLRSAGRLRATGAGRRGANGLPLLGLVLLAAGSVGVLAGRLLQAAFSRQREYLADAAAVQYTRNAAGIAGALYRIAHDRRGGRLDAPRAEEVAHMCIAASGPGWGWLATHPPLAERIRRIDPHHVARRHARARAASRRGAQERPGAAGPAGAAVAAVGTVSAAALGAAAELRRSLPAVLVRAAEDADAACAALYALLSCEHQGDEAAAHEVIRSRDGADALERTRALALAAAAVPAGERLALVTLLLPALRDLPLQRRARVLATVRALPHADRRVTLFELLLGELVAHALGAGDVRVRRVRFRRYADVTGALRVLLSALAREGAASPQEAARNFARVMRYFTREPVAPAPAAEATPAHVALALERLGGLDVLLRRSLLGACADLVLADGAVDAREHELLQLTALRLDCPLPPLLPGVGLGSQVPGRSMKSKNE